jgi:hypothetical protein
LYNNTKFEGNCKLYSIYLSPYIYDLSELYKIGPGDSINGSVTPQLYNEDNFRPYRGYYLKDSYNMIDEVKNNREELHRLLDDMIDNPLDYEIKGKRYINIRGIFENVSTIYSEIISEKIVF